MTPWLDDGDVRVLHGDCIDVMRSLPAESIDAIITDPPYGLGFMGRAWDDLPPGVPWALECLRVLKPGGHLAAFGGTRTAHRLACAIEDAGFEIRDTLAYLYGSGFPKSLDVSKAIDKMNGRLPWIEFAPAFAAAVRAKGMTYTQVDRALGVDAPGASSCYWARTDHRGGLPARHHWEKLRELLALDEGLSSLYDAAEREVLGQAKRTGKESGTYGAFAGDNVLTAPATPAAEAWQGWGTALKPAHEPITLARKPLAGTVAANVLKHGTGALHVDACRIAGAKGDGNWKGAGAADPGSSGGWASVPTDENAAGRWPANVILDEQAAAILDQQTGELHSQDPRTRKSSAASGGVIFDRPGMSDCYADRGGASRFFYTAKASASERNDGLHDLPESDGRTFGDREPGPRSPNGQTATRTRNTHPTVKPVDLMRWLIRLLAPPGALILDPFAGSGTTGVAARAENTRCILIEREAEYLPIIAGRLSQLSLLGGHA